MLEVDKASSASSLIETTRIRRWICADLSIAFGNAIPYEAATKCIRDCMRRYFLHFSLSIPFARNEKRSNRWAEKWSLFARKEKMYPLRVCDPHTYVYIFHHRNALQHKNCVEFEPERRQRRVRCDAVWRHLGAEFAHFVRNEKPNRKFTCNFYFSERRAVCPSCEPQRIA